MKDVFDMLDEHLENIDRMFSEMEKVDDSETPFPLWGITSTYSTDSRFRDHDWILMIRAARTIH